MPPRRSVSRGARSRLPKLDSRSDAEKIRKGMATAPQRDGTALGVATPVVLAPSLAGDWNAFLLLLGLYTLQGIPIGLAAAIPAVLMSKGAFTFSDAATFSLASWPYSLKLLWAPIVDSLYTTRWNLGQRKTWTIATQLVAGLVMILLGSNLSVDNLPPASALAASFFMLYLLVATQDVAVDGWALTMLQPRNLGYASTANTVGQTFGIMLSYSLLMAFDGADFSNNWIRKPLGMAVRDKGLISLDQFIIFWGFAFIAFTLLLWVFKKEEESAPAGNGAPSTELAVVASPSSSEHVHQTHGTSITESSMLPMAVAGDESGAGGGVLSTSSSVASSRPKRSGKTPTNGSAASTSSSSAPSRGRRSPARSSPKSDSSDEEEDVGSEETDENNRLLPAPLSSVSSRSSKSSPGASSRSSRGGGRTSSSAAPAAASSGVASTASAAPSVDGTCHSAYSAVKAAYKDLGSVLRIPHVIALAIVMLTSKAGFTATDSATSLVLQSRGLSKEQLALQDVISTPIQLAMQVLVSKWTAGPKPMSLFLKAFPLRAVAGLLWLAVIVFMMQPSQLTGSPVPPSTATVITIFTLSNLHSLVTSVMFLAQISFFTQIADPVVGGSYMTLLNTVSNLGSKWPQFFTLKGIDWLTTKQCMAKATSTVLAGHGTCSDEASKTSCSEAGGVCTTVRDGYLTMVLVGTLFSAVWFVLMRGRVKLLEETPRNDWLLVRKIERKSSNGDLSEGEATPRESVGGSAGAASMPPPPAAVLSSPSSAGIAVASASSPSAATATSSRATRKSSPASSSRRGGARRS
jgi:Acetyl-coenzyme A transporter 1